MTFKSPKKSKVTQKKFSTNHPKKYVFSKKAFKSEITQKIAQQIYSEKIEKDQKKYFYKSIYKKKHSKKDFQKS